MRGRNAAGRSRSLDRTWVLLLAALLLARLVSMWLIPLTDATEARYGEIARLMVETGDWVAPQFDYGVPFWAKPPLSTWLAAFSMKLLGVSAFAARLPSLLSAVGTLLLTFDLARRWKGTRFAMTATLMLASSALFFIAAGAVMTDGVLTFCTTACLVGYWRLQRDRSRPWGWLPFLAVAGGLLAKGPVAVVLAVLPVGLWTLWQGRTRELRERLPWLRGGLLATALAAPWYVAAEHRTPGFLRYFLVGEHLHRFVQAGWSGDRYGHPHTGPLGMIWVYALLAALPWSLAAPWLALAGRRRSGHSLPAAAADRADPLLRYVICWGVAPLVFFTFTHNVLCTYALPSMPAIALLSAHLVAGSGAGRRSPARLLGIGAAAMACAALAATALFQCSPRTRNLHAQDQLVTAFRELSHGRQACLRYYPKRSYSAEFYSRGGARAVASSEGIRAALRGCPDLFLATTRAELEHLPASLRRRFEPKVSVEGKVLLESRPLDGAEGARPIARSSG